MSTPEDYDLLVLGSGEAGKYIAWTLASQGKRAFRVIEKSSKVFRIPWVEGEVCVALSFKIR